MISSRANATVKRTVRLQKRSEREKRGVFLVEGHRAIGVAVAARVRLLAVFHTPAAARSREPLIQSLAGATTHAVTAEIMAYLTGHDHPPDMLAIAPLRPAALRRAIDGDLVVVLDGVRDPGVAGGILAAAAGAAAAGAIAVAGTTDVFAPACVRAAAGAHFVMPVATGLAAPDVAAALARHRVAVLSERGSPVCSENMRPPIALVVGDGPLPELLPGAEHVCVPAGPSGVSAGTVGRAAVALHVARNP